MVKRYRRSYESLYKRLCWEFDIPEGDIQNFTDYELLSKLNELLKKWNCEPLTEQELKNKLI